jgi:O-acetyl-ADP-ribose deacetylase (regulator of RNase III)
VPDKTSLQIGATRVEIVNAGLLEANTSAIMLSANNKLKAGSGWSREVEKHAGSMYLEECAWLSRSAGSQGLSPGTAVVAGAGDLARTSPIRRIIQAITIRYDNNSQRVPATPEIVYGAVRAGLEKAEIYHIGAVATYLMAVRPGFATAPPEEMSEALFRAVLDHAAIASSVKLVSICESDPSKYLLAQGALNKVAGKRVD